MKEIRNETGEAGTQVVTFRVGAEEYGLDIGSIAEVIRPLKITPLPRMPEFVEGVINLRGTIIPVVDLGRRFGVTGAVRDQRRARMIITKGAAGRADLLGLAVDEVSEVIRLTPEQIDRAPESARGRHAEFIGGMGKLADRLIILVDLSRVLSREERVALAEANDAGA